jgi:hypothetical protein
MKYAGLLIPPSGLFAIIGLSDASAIAFGN